MSRCFKTKNTFLKMPYKITNKASRREYYPNSILLVAKLTNIRPRRLYEAFSAKKLTKYETDAWKIEKIALITKSNYENTLR